MQPPNRGQASPEETIVERVRAWAKRPTAEATIAVCDELRSIGVPAVRGAHVDPITRGVQQRYAKSPLVLVALGKLQLAIGKLGDAQQTFVNAGRLDPDARAPYRYLGEVLLRRGDAVRAEKMLGKALALGVEDDGAKEWLDHARALKSVQEQQGEGAVAGQIAMRPPTSPPRRSLRAPAPIASPNDDEPTAIKDVGPDLKSVRKPSSRGMQAVDPARFPPPPKAPSLDAAIDDVVTIARSPSQTGPLPPPSPPPKSSRPPPPVHDDLIEASDLPTIRRDSDFDDDDQSTIDVPPSQPQDASPEPDLLPTAPRRALKPNSITYGEDGLPRVSAPVPAASAPPRSPAQSAPSLQGYAAPEPIRPAPPPAIAATAVAVANPFVPAAAIGNPYAVPGAKPVGLPPPGAYAEGSAGEIPPADRVLEALARTGVYERGAASTSAAEWMSRRELHRDKRRWGSIGLYAALVLLVGGGVFGALRYGAVRKAKRAEQAEEKALHAESLVRIGGYDELAGAEKDLSDAFDLDSRNLRSARVWLEDRALRSYVWPSEDRKDQGLAGAIERGREVGIDAKDTSFAQITLALSSDDTPSAVAVARELDPGSSATKDAAWTELAVGWALERAGDARAVERYAHAVSLDDQLVPARLYLAKVAASNGDADKVNDLTKDFPDDLSATKADLVALAGLVKTGAPAGAAGAKDQRRPNGFEWIAPAIVLADPKATADDKKDAGEAAVKLASVPADLTRIGRLAYAAGENGTAMNAALKALEISPIYPAARALAAHLALVVGRPDDAAKALEGVGGDPEVAALQGWIAYEHGDVDAVDKALAADGLDRADLQPIVRPLKLVVALAKKNGAVSKADLDELNAVAKLGELGPAVAFDVLMDAGDLDDAAKIPGFDGDTTKLNPQPGMALRLARLARLKGDAKEADRLSAIAVSQDTISPKALVERVLVLCALGKGQDALNLLSRFSLLANDEQPWLRAYATAAAGKAYDAKRMTDALKDPDDRAPWPVRRDALLAVAAANDDKRAKALLKDDLGDRPKDPDVLAVQKAIGDDKK